MSRGDENLLDGPHVFRDGDEYYSGEVGGNEYGEGRLSHWDKNPKKALKILQQSTADDWLDYFRQIGQSAILVKLLD
jgi:hypothetical protein